MSHLIEQVKDLTIPSITKIINSCINRNCFVETTEISKVIPLLKKGHRNYVNNHRPISIFPVFRKNMKKFCIYKFLDTFIKTTFFQTANLALEPTEGQPMFDFINFVTDAEQICKWCIGMFLDLSKAFVCIHHDVLLKKYLFTESMIIVISCYKCVYRIAFIVYRLKILVPVLLPCLTEFLKVQLLVYFYFSYTSTTFFLLWVLKEYFLRSDRLR